MTGSASNTGVGSATGPRSLSTGRAVLYGTLAVGTLDILDAFIFFGIRSGAKPLRILQSIASGVISRFAFSGGYATAALGLLVHYFIAFGIVVVYVAASRRTPVLRAHPFVCGPLYGVAAWLAMNFVFLPLSLAGAPTFVPAVVANGLLIHAFGVGLPAAYFASRAR